MRFPEEEPGFCLSPAYSTAARSVCLLLDLRYLSQKYKKLNLIPPGSLATWNLTRTTQNVKFLIRKVLPNGSFRKLPLTE